MSKPASPTVGGDARNSEDAPSSSSTDAKTASAPKSGKSVSTPRVGRKKSSPSPKSASAGGLVDPPLSEHKESDDEFLRALYVTNLEVDRIAALESSHDALSSTCVELQKSLSAQDARHNDMFIYKQRETARAADHTKSLDALILGLHSAAAASAIDAQKVLELERQAAARNVRELEERMAGIQAKYMSLFTFAAEKAALEGQLATYKSLLESEQSAHSLNVSELERRNVMEKDRLKNEMLRKIRETKLSLLAMTEDQLHTTTKRTIMENEQMTTELQYQSKETERIVRRNTKLDVENAGMRRELELSAGTQQMMAKKTMFYQNLIGKLQSKLDTTGSEREKEQQSFAQAVAALQAQLQYVQTQSAAAAAAGGSGGGAGRGGKHAHLHSHAHAHANANNGANDRASSSLSSILRGVDELHQITSGSGGGGNKLIPSHPAILPRNLASPGGRKNGGESRLIAAAASAASSPTSSSSSSAASSAAVDADYARLSERVALLDRERLQSGESQRLLTSQLRDERLARLSAIDSCAALTSELAEANAALHRLRSSASQSSSLNDRALQFMSTCLEDQRMSRLAEVERAGQHAREREEQVVTGVQAQGSEATIIVRAAGERAGQPNSASSLQSPSLLSPSATSSLSYTPLGLPSSSSPPPHSAHDLIGGGYPSSLASFSAADRFTILEHLLSQMSIYQRGTNDHASSNHQQNQQQRDRSDNDDRDAGTNSRTSLRADGSRSGSRRGGGQIQTDNDAQEQQDDDNENNEE